MPSAPGWRWNQTKGKKETVLPLFQAKVILTKLIPRRRANANESFVVPLYKMWVFVVTFENPTRTITVLWCEKGEIQTVSSSPVLQRSPDNSYTHFWLPPPITIHPFVTPKPKSPSAHSLAFICN